MQSEKIIFLEKYDCGISTKVGLNGLAKKPMLKKPSPLRIKCWRKICRRVSPEQRSRPLSWDAPDSPQWRPGLPRPASSWAGARPTKPGHTWCEALSFSTSTRRKHTALPPPRTRLGTDVRQAARGRRKGCLWIIRRFLLAVLGLPKKEGIHRSRR